MLQDNFGIGNLIALVHWSYTSDAVADFFQSIFQAKIWKVALWQPSVEGDRRLNTRWHHEWFRIWRAVKSVASLRVGASDAAWVAAHTAAFTERLRRDSGSCEAGIRRSGTSGARVLSGNMSWSAQAMWCGR